jgi:hypothetical protein
MIATFRELRKIGLKMETVILLTSIDPLLKEGKEILPPTHNTLR